MSSGLSEASNRIQTGLQLFGMLGIDAFGGAIVIETFQSFVSEALNSHPCYL